LKHVTCVEVKVFLVVQFTLLLVELDFEATVLANFLSQSLSVELGDVGSENLLEIVALVSELTIELAGKLGCSQVDLDEDLVCLVLRVHVVNLADQDGATLHLTQVEDWHSSLSHDLVGVLVDDEREALSRLFLELVVDFNLIVNRNARALTEALDAVGHFTSNTDVLKLVSLDNIKHNRALHVASNSPLLALGVLLFEVL